MFFHEAISRAFVDQGITIVFGVIGDGNLFMMDSFQRLHGGTYVSVSHEATGVLAANGYARTSGGIGVATVTHGPGLTNTITSLIEGVKDRSPIVLIAGDTAVADRDNFQNVPQRSVIESIGAGFEQVRTPSSVFDDVAMAVRRARSERRPIVLNVPVEFQWLDVYYEYVAPVLFEVQRPQPDPVALDVAVGMIASARRPIVLAGRGAATPQARVALIRLADRIGAPVATTLRGKDLFRGEWCDLGVFGTLSNSVALDVILKSDCVVAFGAGLNRWTTAESSLLESKRVVHVDVDPFAINQFSRVNAGIVGDAAVVADTIVAWLDDAQVPASGFATPEIVEQLAAQARAPAVMPRNEGRIDLEAAIVAIDQAVPSDRSLVLDGGRFVLKCFTMMHAPNPQAYVHTLNFGAIGLGMGNAIGAAYGGPGRPVLLVCGDGGFMLGGIGEFASAVRHGVDLVVIVFDDGAYGAEHIQFRQKNMDPAISTFAWPDFGPVATALGGQGFTVRTWEELDAALDTLEHRDRPVLIDVKLDPDSISMAAH